MRASPPRLSTALARRLLWLGLCALPSAPALAADADVRVLHAGDSRLRVEVIGVADPARAALLQRWLADAARAPLTVAPRFPLADATVEIREVNARGDSPVPWGQTERDDDVRVLLYVRAGASLDELRGDWTAVHELSHLFHPYLGEHGRWLAEGLASYYQNVLRARLGTIDGDDAWRRLDAGFRRGMAASGGRRLDDMGRRSGGTMRVYWGGAAYWLEADLALRRERATTLDAVLADYDRCCLRGTDAVAPADFVAALDRVAGGDTFSRLYARYAASTEFPSLDAAYRQLGIVHDARGLRFDAAHAPLRAAIMRARPGMPARIESRADSASVTPEPNRR